MTEVTDEESFDQLRPEWNALVDQMEYPSPFQSWEWNRTWWKHFGGRDKLCILVFRGPEQIVGIAPFYSRSHGLPRWGPPSLVPIGGGHGHKHGLTEQWELLFPQDHRTELFDALSTWLRRSGWSAVLIPGLGEADRLPSWLANRVITSGTVALLSGQLPTTWEEFVRGLNKSMRDNVKYYPKLMARHGHEYLVHAASTPLEVSRWLPVMLRLHRARAEWLTRSRHADKFSVPRRREFMAEVAPLLAARGQLRISTISTHGEVVAAEIWMEYGTTMFCYCSGYLPSWAKYSVAMVNTAEALKMGIARGMRSFDLLRGGGQFQERWGARPGYRTHVILGRWPKLIKPILALRGLRPGRLARGYSSDVPPSV